MASRRPAHSGNTRGGAAREAGCVVKLTPAEAEVVAQVALGLSNKEVAAVLNETEASVKGRLARVFQKLGVKNRLQLIVLFRS